jgi:molybdopterin synthase sulfur carrier subunit
MIKVLFFAQIRELVDCDELEVNSPFDTVDALLAELVTKGDKWALALDSDKLLVAVNQEICSLDSALSDGDEVAFFPPVTGG